MTNTRGAWIAIVSASILFLSGAVSYMRWSNYWYRTRDIRGFVPYGFHDSLFSPDASGVAVTFRERGKVIDLSRGGVEVELEKYTGQGLSDYSITKMIVSYFSSDKSNVSRAILWNATSGRIIGSIIGPEGKCFPVFTPEGDNILGITKSGLLIWDTDRLERIGEVRIEWSDEQWLRGVLAWGATSHDLATIDGSGRVIRIDLLSQKTEPLFPDQEQPVKLIRWSSDGRKLLTINQEDESVSVWDIQSRKVLAQLPINDVRFACFSHDGTQVVTSTLRTKKVQDEQGVPTIWNRSTKFWNANTGEVERELSTAGFVTLSPDWSFIAETSPKGLRIARLDGSESTFFRNWFDGHGSISEFSQNNSYLASVNGSGRVAVWRYCNAASFFADFLFRFESWAMIFAFTSLLWSIAGCIKRKAQNTKLNLVGKV
ncbi:MAG: WD40 repeat domain-containing protein [Pirellula sp.]|nr:WD40 repeat domain-containing protein [Pirellula sp.]